MSFIENLTLYVLDPQDDSIMWRYQRYQKNDKGEPNFQRFYVAKDDEKAIRQALKNDAKLINQLNKEIKDARGSSIAVLRIDGNRRENFRDYKF